MTGPSCNYVCAMRPSFDLNVNQCSSFLSDQTKALNGLWFRFKISLVWRRQDIFSHPRSCQSAFGQLRRWIIHFLIWQKTVCWALSMEKWYATQFLSLSSNLNYVLFDPTILQAFFASNNWVLALIMNVSTVTAHSTASIVFNGSHRSGVMDGNAFERNTKSTNWRFKERMYRTD